MRQRMLPEVTGRPIFSESRIFRSSRIVDSCGFNTRHDNREVKLIEFFESLLKAEFVRIFTECSEVFRSVD